MSGIQKFFCTLGLVVLPLMVKAQAPDTLWTRVYGGLQRDIGNCVHQTSDGAYIIAGVYGQFSSDYGSLYLLKTDSNGNKVWSKLYGGPSWDWGEEVEVLADGYVVVGVTRSFGSGDNDVWLLKTDLNGDTLWTRTFGGVYVDFSKAVQVTSDSGFIIVGGTNSFNPWDFDVYVIKTDFQGHPIWSRTYGGDTTDEASDVCETSDHGFLVVGFTRSYGSGEGDIYLLRLASNGDTLWTKTIGGDDSDCGNKILPTSDGGYIICGSTSSFGAGGSDVFVVKIDQNGSVIWTKTYGGTDDEGGNSIQKTSDGGYVIIGTTRSFGAGKTDIYLIKIDSLGNTLWTTTFGQSDYELGYSVEQTSDQGYILVGATESYGSGAYDVWLIKTEPDISVKEEGVKRTSHPIVPRVCFGDLLIISGIEHKTEVKIFDILGKEVMRRELSPQSSKIPVHSLSTGVYYLLFKRGFPKTAKVVLIK